MNLHHLRCFQVVAQENHITRASQKLNIAQPALSANISKLEKELGVPLFDRIGRQVVLNECGQILLNHVNIILDQWEEANSRLEQYKREHRQQIKLAITGILFPQHQIRDFKLKYPDVLIKQSNIMVDEIASSLIRRKSDFVISSILVENEEISSHFLKDERLYLLANRSHPLSNRDAVHVEDLAGESFISLPEGYAYRQILDEWFHNAGLRHNVVLECFPSQFSDLVSQNIGLSFASESTVSEDIYPPELATIPIEPPLRRGLYILYLKSMPFSQVCQIFYKHAVGYYAS